MRAADFKDSPAGTLTPTISGQHAFLPNELPPAIDYPAIISPFSTAMQAIGELNGLARQLENPLIVIRPLQRQEALSSSAMEGTFTTANALALADANADQYVDEATKEVRNYVRAFDEARRMLNEVPVSNRLIRATHQVLLSGLSTMRGANKQPGEYKSQQNFIGGGSRRIEDARFVPPPPHETQLAMAALERYLNRADDNGIPALIDAALMHYQFEAIHPFADGNGRIGRILIPIYLIQRGILQQPLLYFSPAVEGQKTRYVDAMLAVSKKGAWTEWLVFFLDAVTAACGKSAETIGRLLTLRDQFRQKIAESGGSARYAVVADRLFFSPVTSAPEAAALLQVSFPAAQNALARLEKLGIVSSLSYTSHPKRYISTPVLEITDPVAS
ncbi:MAG: Fic family protein [Mesorhizobium sp.]|nr:Fic family protein [Mesorhizobium sp.]